MKKVALALVALAVAVAPLVAAPATAQTKLIRVGWCSRTISGAATPFAVAAKMGWFKADAIEVELVPMAGSSDCTKNVLIKEVPFALASVEPLAASRAQSAPPAKIFYTAYQGNIYGIAVPADSPVKKMTDLKGKNIGVIAMGSAGVQIARALAATSGMDPQNDINVVVAGEGAQTAAMLRNKQVDALSQFDTQYAMVENAGVKLRMLDTKDIDRYPSNGFLALDETLKSTRREAVALGRGYAKGTIFAINNPEAAIRILYEIIRDDVKVLQVRAVNWKLDKAGVKKWGENSEANYAAYAEFMLKWSVIKQKVDARELISNELIGEINNFDSNKIAAEAKAYKYGK
jgi:NitT/TauT family transport system substrate-binding protein